MILLTRKNTQPPMTTRVIKSATPSDINHQLISHACFHKMTCANRNMGTMRRLRWKAKVTMVKNGFFLQLVLANGTIQ